MQEVNDVQLDSEEAVISTKKVALVIGGLVVGLISLGLVIGYTFFWDKPIYGSPEDYQFQTAYNNVKKSPRDAKLRIELGWMYLQRQEYDKAIAEYQNALKIDPKNNDAKLNLALVYAEKKDYAKAKADLEKMVKDNPVFIDARIALGNVYYHTKDYNKAQEQYQFVVNANPGTVDYITLLGMVLEAKGDKKGAIAQYEKALAYVPTYEPAAEGLKRLTGNVKGAKSTPETKK